MRINLPHKSIDMEVRDINYVLGAFIRSYLFASKNEDPEKIVFPMYPVVPHPNKPNVLIPIEYIPSTDQFVAELIKDGSNIPEVTPAEEAAIDYLDKKAEEIIKNATTEVKQEEVLDDKDEEIKRLKTQVSSLLAATSKNKPEVISPARAAMNRLEKKGDSVDRIPKMPPGGDIGAGHPDNLGSRDIKLTRQIVGDLKDEPEVDEGKEISTDIEKPKS